MTTARPLRSRYSPRNVFPALAERLTDLDFQIAELERIEAPPDVIASHLAELRAERDRLAEVYDAAERARRRHE